LLNYIWGGFFLVGFVVALIRFSGGDETVFQSVIQSTFDMAKLSVDIAIGLVGLLALWSGLFRIAEQAGLITSLSRLLAPFFSRVMPEVPKGHAAQGAVTMNLAANMLGLDNAATPLGLKAMQALQSLNQQCADPVPGSEYFLSDFVAGHHLYVSRPVGGGRSHRCLYPDIAGYQRIHSERSAGGDVDPEDSAGSGAVGLSGGRSSVDKWLYLLVNPVGRSWVPCPSCWPMVCC